MPASVLRKRSLSDALVRWRPPGNPVIVVQTNETGVDGETCGPRMRLVARANVKDRTCLFITSEYYFTVTDAAGSDNLWAKNRRREIALLFAI
jgi:hypothetical protein